MTASYAIVDLQHTTYGGWQDFLYNEIHIYEWRKETKKVVGERETDYITAWEINLSVSKLLIRSKKKKKDTYNTMTNDLNTAANYGLRHKLTL